MMQLVELLIEMLLGVFIFAGCAIVFFGLGYAVVRACDAITYWLQKELPPSDRD
jgi:hypothetical protein